MSSDSDKPQMFPLSFLTGLRFPQLFVILAVLLLLDIILLDPVPGIDELLLGVMTLMIGRLKKSTSRVAAPVEKPAEKNVTPEQG